jgi:hypothetical protein
MRKIFNGYRGVAMAMVVLMVGIMLAGCQAGAPSKPAADVIKAGLAKLMTATAFTYDVSLKGSSTDDYGTENKFDLAMAGQFDVKDAKDAKLTMKVTGSVSAGEAMGGKGVMDFRLNKEALYFNIMELTSDSGDVPAEVQELFKKWWKITLPAEAADEMAKSVPMAEEAKMTPEQLQVKKALEESNMFGTPTYVKNENIKGEDCFQYNVTLDIKGLVAFMRKIAEAQGETITDEDVTEMEETLKNLKMTGDIYVGSKSGMVQKFSGKVSMADENGKTQGSFDLSVTLSDVGKSLTFDAPKDATEFPVEDFMAGFMGGYSAASDLETTGDISPYDDSTMDFTTDPTLNVEEGAETGISG